MAHPRTNEQIKQAIEELENKQTKTNNRTSEYEETASEKKRHWAVFKKCANAILHGRGETYKTDDEKTQHLVMFLIAYLNGWEETFNEHCEKLRQLGVIAKYNIHNPIFLIGDKGVGKTLLMQAGQHFAEVMGLWDRWYTNTSCTELLNHFRTNNNLDYYTYQTKKKEVITGYSMTAAPRSICLNDLGLEKEAKQLFYGNDLSGVIDEFLLSRYELSQTLNVQCHVTTNLDLSQVGELYPSRVIDRFKQSNFIVWQGESRR